MKKFSKQAVGDFLAGRGFYIVLFLCAAAVGVSGWYLTREMVLPPANEPVGGQAVVTITPDATPVVPPVVTPKPTPSEVPTATPNPAPSPSAEPVPSPEPSQTPAASLWGADLYTWPVKGGIVGDFSLEVLAYDETMGDWRVHDGLDIAAAMGTNVKATSAGTVSAVYEDDLMGTVVVISHKDGLESLYANLAARPAVEPGDEVSTGGVIGMVGDTAIAEVGKPSHLHFEMRQDGRNVDPMEYLPQA